MQTIGCTYERIIGHHTSSLRFLRISNEDFTKSVKGCRYESIASILTNFLQACGKPTGGEVLAGKHLSHQPHLDIVHRLINKRAFQRRDRYFRWD